MGPVYKPTRWLSNSRAIMTRLGRKCTRAHRHIQLVSGRAAKAAIYPPELCLQVLRGLRDQVRLDSSLGNEISSLEQLNSLSALGLQHDALDENLANIIGGISSLGPQTLGTLVGISG